MSKNKKKPLGKPDGKPIPKKAIIKKGTFSRLFKYIWKYNKTRLIIVAISIVIASIGTVLASVILQQLIDNVIRPGIVSGLSSVSQKLITMILFMGSIYLLSVFASFIYTRIMANVTQSTLYRLRIDMFDKMETLPVKYYDTHPHGEIMSTYTNDTDALRQLIGQSIPSVFQAGLTMITIVIMMLSYSIWLTLVVLLVIFVMINLSKKIAGGSAKYMVKQQSSLAAEEGFVEELIEGQKVVKVFNYEEEGKAKFNKFNNKLYRDSKKANTYSNVLMPIMGNMGNIMYVIVAIVGGILMINNVSNISIGGSPYITLGIVVVFLTSVRALSQTVGQTSNQVGMISMGLAGSSRIFKLMDQPSEEDNGYVTLVRVEKDEQGNLIETKERINHWAWKHYHKGTGLTDLVELKGEIVLENVNFCYVPEQEVLHDITFYGKAGQKVALVGATGAGKTTITNLINRFYDIPDGKIRYDGINIRKIRKPDLRRSLGIVLQDVNLFTGTVMENIRYGRLNATDEQCIDAAKLANAHDFITRLPDGYQSVLDNNGSNLSQGQRQLLSIARAAVADTPAMILDEATSSIDTRTEELVQKGMDNLMEGRTVFVIAHRLSTVKNSDAIMVMDHGRIIERGTHDQLLGNKGVYYQLYTGAFELE
jgi:ATP-binding cassette subfamily B protein